MEVPKVMKITKQELENIIKEEISEIAKTFTGLSTRERSKAEELAQIAMNHAEMEGYEGQQQRILAKRILQMALNNPPIFNPEDEPMMENQNDPANKT